MTGIRVLVVEDDADIRRSLEIVRGRAGYTTSWATDGVMGLQRFTEERPDLVVLDVGLPRLGGWAVLERLRQLSDVPVLVPTARGLDDGKVRGLMAGAGDSLAKPYRRAWPIWLGLGRSVAAGGSGKDGAGGRAVATARDGQA